MFFMVGVLLILLIKGHHFSNTGKEFTSIDTLLKITYSFTFIDARNLIIQLCKKDEEIVKP